MIKNALAALSVAVVLAFCFIQADAQSKTPVIVIPGITGSELINHRTGEVVWFKAPRSKDDDLRLPINADPTRSRDNLVAGDILRKIKFGIFPVINPYDGLIKSFENTGGYHEESWDQPSKRGGDSALYVFAYDWRLDNVGNARLLIRKIERLRLKLKQPKLKFNVVGHSMGGIIARYAAMYGTADLPATEKKPLPTWAGAKYFDKLVMLGTPNEGSALALNSLVNGVSIGGLNINLPWVQNLTKFDLFTLPSIYQLLPAPGTLRAFDADLKPVAIDLYDTREWSKYGWNATDDRKFDKNFSPADRRSAKRYFAAALDRARRLGLAMAVAATPPAGLEIGIVGSGCKESLDAIVVIQDPKSTEWKTLFKPSGFTRANGEKVSSDQLKTIMFAPGDGTVTLRSLESRSASITTGAAPSLNAAIAGCSEHNELGANADIQARILAIFAGRKL